MDKVIEKDKYYRWELEDLNNFDNLDMLHSYIKQHYGTYTKETLAKIIYSLVESCIASKYTTDKQVYGMFLACIEENNKYFE
jgi:hypothetical protein